MTSPGEHNRWILTLYINGASSLSMHAVQTIREVCDNELEGRVDLSIVDVRDRPDLLLDEKVFATPTLIKSLPEPLRRLVGDLSDAERVRVGLDLDETPTA